MNDLTLIIPAKYEKESLPKVLDELKKFDVKKNIVLEKLLFCCGNKLLYSIDNT